MIQTTEQELQAIVAQLKPYIMEYIRQYSVGVGEIELATTLEGVYSLPALMRLGGVDKIVEVPVELLQVAVSNVVDECVAATQSANTAAQAATDAGNSASAVIADLEELKTSITQAISESATAIQGANTAKDNANTAAAAANEAADKANKAAEGVSESISAANTAAQGANKAKENAETAANAAVAAAGKVDSSITASRNLPKIQNGTWWVYDIESETYVDSGNPATGRSPKIQDGTWWVWNDETSQYANTGVSVNSAYELTKEKVENVLTGDITSHTHSYLSDAPEDGQTYGRKSGEWVTVSGGTESVDITEIYNKIPKEEGDAGSFTQEDFNVLLAYLKGGKRLYVIIENSARIDLISYYTTDDTTLSMVAIYPYADYTFTLYNIFCSSNGESYAVGGSYLDAKSVAGIAKLVNYAQNKSYSAISESDTINNAIGKLEAGLIALRPLVLNENFYNLDNDSTSEEISTAIGGLDGLNNIISHIKAGGNIYLNMGASGYNLQYVQLIVVGISDKPKTIMLKHITNLLDGGAKVWVISYDSEQFSCQII